MSRPNDNFAGRTPAQEMIRDNDRLRSCRFAGGSLIARALEAPDRPLPKADHCWTWTVPDGGQIRKEDVHSIHDLSAPL